jgi:hypothetical protein
MLQGFLVFTRNLQGMFFIPEGDDLAENPSQIGPGLEEDWRRTDPGIPGGYARSYKESWYQD